VNVTQLTGWIGALLIVVGIGGYILTDMVSRTALIPAVIGAVLIGLAFLGRSERRRRHAMHGAMIVALAGIAGSARGLMQLPALLSGESVARPAAVYAQSMTAVALLILLVAGIRSFVAARR
jgi:hypothetical protein